MENINELQGSQRTPMLPAPKKFHLHKGIITIIILVLIAGTAIWVYFILNQPQDLGPIMIQHTIKKMPGVTITSSSSPTTLMAFQTYNNPVYNYSFQYPASYILTDGKKHDFQYINTQYSDWLQIDVGLDDAFNNYGTTTQDFINQAAGLNPNVSENLSSICDSDGPNGGTSCDKILQENTWVTPNRISCYELYLEQTENLLQTSTHPASYSILGSIGPLYACDITAQTNHTARALLITPTFKYPPIGDTSRAIIPFSPEEITQIKDLINSIHFLK